MARYIGGNKVPGGYYWNPRSFGVVTIPDAGAKLPGKAGDRFLRLHWAVALLLTPVLGGLFVVALPFIGLAAFLRIVAGAVTGSARDGARDLAATVTPGWRPGEVHMTGRAAEHAPEELPAGGAAEKALEDVAAEVARKRAEGNGKDG